jgi:hypothetical protein
MDGRSIVAFAWERGSWFVDRLQADDVVRAKRDARYEPAVASYAPRREPLASSSEKREMLADISILSRGAGARHPPYPVSACGPRIWGLRGACPPAWRRARRQPCF